MQLCCESDIRAQNSSPALTLEITDDSFELANSTCQKLKSCLRNLRNGVKISKWMNYTNLSNTRKRKKSIASILNSTTRLTRSVEVAVELSAYADSSVTFKRQDGRPVYIEQLGKLDLNKLYTVTTPERQLQRLVVEYEKFLRDRLPICTAMRSDGEIVDTSCTIMDLNGVGVSQFWKVKTFVQEAAKISQDYYPGKFKLIQRASILADAYCRTLQRQWASSISLMHLTSSRPLGHGSSLG